MIQKCLMRKNSLKPLGTSSFTSKEEKKTPYKGFTVHSGTTTGGVRLASTPMILQKILQPWPINDAEALTDAVNHRDEFSCSFHSFVLVYILYYWA